MELARRPVRGLMAPDRMADAVAAGHPAAALHDAEQLHRPRLVLADVVAGVEVHHHSPAGVAHAHDGRQDEVAAELVDVVAGVRTERDELHRPTIPQTAGGTFAGCNCAGSPTPSSPPPSSTHRPMRSWAP